MTGAMRGGDASDGSSIADTGGVAATSLDESVDSPGLAVGFLTALTAVVVAVLVVPGGASEQEIFGRTLTILGVVIVVNGVAMRRAFAPVITARRDRLARSEGTDAQVVAVSASRKQAHVVRFVDHHGMPREATLALLGASRVGDSVAIRFDRDDPAWALDERAATTGMRILTTLAPAFTALGAVLGVIGLGLTV